MNISSQVGNLDVYGAYIGSGGMSLVTESGEIVLIKVNINGSSTGPHASAVAATTYGGIQAVNMTLTDCVLSLSSKIGTLFVNNVQR